MSKTYLILGNSEAMVPPISMFSLNIQGSFCSYRRSLGETEGVDLVRLSAMSGVYSMYSREMQAFKVRFELNDEFPFIERAHVLSFGDFIVVMEIKDLAQGQEQVSSSEAAQAKFRFALYRVGEPLVFDRERKA
jgi:hypothetical protein